MRSDLLIPLLLQLNQLLTNAQANQSSLPEANGGIFASRIRILPGDAKDRPPSRLQKFRPSHRGPRHVGPEVELWNMYAAGGSLICNLHSGTLTATRYSELGALIP